MRVTMLAEIPSRAAAPAKLPLSMTFAKTRMLSKRSTELSDHWDSGGGALAERHPVGVGEDAAQMAPLRPSFACTWDRFESLPPAENSVANPTFGFWVGPPDWPGAVGPVTLLTLSSAAKAVPAALLVTGAIMLHSSVTGR